MTRRSDAPRASSAATIAAVEVPRRDGLAPRPRTSAATHTMEVVGTRIAWVERGSGPPLVLLHGVGDSHRTWRRLAPMLADRYRLLMPDLPGHGLSDRPDAPYTLAWFASVISAWMLRIDVPHAHVVGHSYGGGIAQWLLLDHRERVDRLTLIAAGGLGRKVGLGLRLAALPLPERLFTPAAMWTGTLLAGLLARRTFGDLSLTEALEFAGLNGSRGTGRAFARSVRGVIDVFGQYMQTRAGIGAVPTLPPVAMFWGADDRIIPPDHGRAGLALFRGATLEVFPRCGHYPHLQDPERVAQRLLAFLDDGRGQRLPPPHAASSVEVSNASAGIHSI